LSEALAEPTVTSRVLAVMNGFVCSTPVHSGNSTILKTGSGYDHGARRNLRLDERARNICTRCATVASGAQRRKEIAMCD